MHNRSEAEWKSKSHFIIQVSQIKHISFYSWGSQINQISFEQTPDKNSAVGWQNIGALQLRYWEQFNQIFGEISEWFTLQIAPASVTHPWNQLDLGEENTENNQESLFSL